MSKGNESASFAINFEGNVAQNAKVAAESLQGLQARIRDNDVAAKAMSSSLRKLTGSTAEVAAAKQDLRARVLLAKQAIAQDTLEQYKLEKASGLLGKSTKNLAAEQKKLAAESAATTAKEGQLAGAVDKAGSAMNLVEVGAAGAAVAVVAVAAAFAAAVVSAGKFAIVAADAARTTRLMNEAASNGNAKWGKNLSDQVDALASKLPTSKNDLAKLGRELELSGLDGKVWEQTFRAVAQTASALGEGPARKLGDFVERGRQLQKFRLDPREMIGTGVDFDDVAKALATSMHVGIEKARAELRSGRLDLAKGAEALNAAVTAKYSGINSKLAVSLPALAQKFSESLSDLTKGIDLDPLLNGIKSVADVFSLTTQSGQELKSIVEVFGKDLVKSMAAAAPVAKSFIYGLIEGAQDLTIRYLEAKIAFNKWFDKSSFKGLDLVAAAMTTAKIATLALEQGLATTALILGIVATQADLAMRAVGKLGDAYAAVKKAVSGEGVGMAIADGLTGGLASSAPDVTKSVASLGDLVKSTFAKALDSHSPSKEFEKFGRFTTEGYEQGITKGSPGAQSAVDGMIEVPRKSSSAAGGRSGGSPVTVNLTINATGRSPAEVASHLGSAGLLEAITKAITDGVTGAGMPVPA